MKKLITAIILLITIKANSQTTINPSMNLQAGYVSDHYTHFDYSFGVNLKRDEERVYPIAEIGGKFQLTENNVAQVVGGLVGIEYSNEKMFISGSGGIGYVFNLPIIDRYKPNDSTQITISEGYAKPYFFSPYASLKAGVYVNGENAIPVFIDLSYTGKLVWLGLGIKITF